MRTRRIIALGAIAALAVGACSSSSGSTAPSAAASAAPPSAAASAAASAGASTAASTAPSIGPAALGPGEGQLNLAAWAYYVIGGTGGEQVTGAPDWVTPFEK